MRRHVQAILARAFLAPALPPTGVQAAGRRRAKP